MGRYIGPIEYYRGAPLVVIIVSIIFYTAIFIIMSPLILLAFAFSGFSPESFSTKLWYRED